MKLKLNLYCFILICSICFLPSMAQAQYPQAGKYYIKLGQKALHQKNYDEALEHFKYAYLAYPSKQVIEYINLTKRLKEQAVQPGVKVTVGIRQPLNISQAQATSIKFEPVNIESELDNKIGVASTKLFAGDMESEMVLEAAQAQVEKRHKRIISSQKSELLETPNKIYLDDELWQSQPGTLLRVELGGSVILEGNNIDNFLIIAPGFIEVERLDRDHIRIDGLKRGRKFLHIWDDRDRWTFNVDIIFPAQATSTIIEEKKKEVDVNPFRLSYSMDWGSFYQGPTLKEAQRIDLNVLHRMSLVGETPYGDFDSAAVFNRSLVGETELTSYTLGLTDGHVGPFERFSFRAFDLNKTFSPLSLPGQYQRGFLLESQVFNETLEYTYVHGQENSSFGFLSAPGSGGRRDAYIEGIKMTLFPEEENQYSMNYVRGYGDERFDFLPDQVYSGQFQRRVGSVLFSGEMAYDENNFARTLDTSYVNNNLELQLNLRDIEPQYNTITNSASNQGEVGGILFADWRGQSADISSSLDIYRDRLLPNPENSTALNYDFQTSFDFTINDHSRWDTSMFYVYTPGEVSERNNLRISKRYSHNFNLPQSRLLTTFLEGTYQFSRFGNAPLSEYDRYTVSTGFRVPLIKQLDYFANAEYSWVDELMSGELLRPYVINTGVSYFKQITDDISGNTYVTYRNEGNTDGLHSFLAGEDSVSTGISMNYRPSPDFELFLDGRLRDVWSESGDRDSFYEADIRWGVRTSWETPFAWSPKGDIEGVVFKDLNGDQKQDVNEPGVSGIRVEVGEESVITNADGEYSRRVRAKQVQVSVDVSSVPRGFIFSTPPSVDVNVLHRGTQKVDFGIGTQSGIYGVVFYDRNKDGQPDSGDEFISRVNVTLDGKEAVSTDFEGVYFFRDVPPGKHTLMLDVNSIPLEYLPRVKIKNDMVVTEGTTYVFHIPLDRNKNVSP